MQTPQVILVLQTRCGCERYINYWKVVPPMRFSVPLFTRKINIGASQPPVELHWKIREFEYTRSVRLDNELFAYYEEIE